MSGPEHGERGEHAASVGPALKQAREAKGLSATDVGEAINLRATVVRAIESDDYTLCGGDVYARGHLRAYAKQVDLDAEPLLAAYAQAQTARAAAAAAGAGSRTGHVWRHHPVGAPVGTPGRDGGPDAAPGLAGGPAQRPPAVRETLEPAPRRPGLGGPVAPLPALRRGTDDVPLERRRPSPAMLVGAALVVLLVFLTVHVVGDLRSPGRGTSEVAQPTQTTPPAQQQSPTSSPTVTAPPSSTLAPAPTSASPAAGVAVAMSVTGDSWVSVSDASGHRVFSGLLVKGDKRKFTDGKGLRLTVGNAGGVRLTVNGKSIGSPGAKGQVVRLHFGPQDPA